MNDPLTPPECDCTDLDGFMLNVERLMASELVAISTHETVAAALFLWCRAWKQKPAASLPDDDRVLAAFARLPMAKFKKLKNEILRGFVKCSDGRLYHRVLAEEAVRAYGKKLAFQKKREADNERLKKWREKRDGNGSETHDETRFVQEGQGQDRDGTEKKDTPPPVPVPSKVTNSKISSFSGVRAGKNGTGVTIDDPHERLARFQSKLAKALGQNGWDIVASATNKADPQHDASLAACKAKASELGKGWPHAWTS